MDAGFQYFRGSFKFSKQKNVLNNNYKTKINNGALSPRPLINLNILIADKSFLPLTLISFCFPFVFFFASTIFRSTTKTAGNIFCFSTLLVGNA